MSVSTSSVLHGVTTVPSNLASTMNISEEERDRYLSYMDEAMFPKRIPAVVYICILMFLGIVGNILVLIVYIKKYKPSSIRVFVLSMAVFDLTTCVVIMPGEILDLRFKHTFNYPNMCRVFRFITIFTVVSSGLTLVAVAIDRYQKICKSQQKQITIFEAKIMMGVVVTVAFVLAIPNGIVNGRATVITDREGITGFDCSFDDRWRNALFPRVYIGFLFFVLSALLTVLIVTYMLIGKTVYSHRKSKSNPSSDPKAQSLQNSPQNVTTGLTLTSHREDIPSSNELTNEFRDETWNSSQSQRAEVVDTTKSKKVICTPEAKPSLPGITPTNSRRNSGVKARRPTIRRKSRTNLMLFIITAVCVVTFMPYWILTIIRGFKPDFVESLQGGSIMVYNIFLRSYLINSAANCIVYCFCNDKFRNACKQLFLLPCLNLKK